MRMLVNRYNPLVDSQGVSEWEMRKIRVWQKQGRLTDDGTLRLPTKSHHRVCHARKIKRLWSHLSIRECHELAMHMYGPTKYRLSQAGV